MFIHLTVLCKSMHGRNKSPHAKGFFRASEIASIIDDTRQGDDFISSLVVMTSGQEYRVAQSLAELLTILEDYTNAQVAQV